jgi:hypothetical protein
MGGLIDGWTPCWWDEGLDGWPGRRMDGWLDGGKSGAAR